MRMMVLDEHAEVLTVVPSGLPPIDFDWLRPYLAERLPFHIERPQSDGPGWVQVRGAPLQDGKSVIAVTPLAGLKNALFVRILSPAIWRLSEEGRVLEATDSLAEWLGTTSDEIVGTYARQWMEEAEAGERFEAEFLPLGGGRKRGVVLRSHSELLGGGAIDIISDLTAEQGRRVRLREEVERMKALAFTDALTGLPNRRAFSAALETAAEGVGPYALALIDLDDLKVINDTHGHAAGDRALIAVAEALRRTVRESDVIARTGGDEFAVLLPKGSASTVAYVESRLRQNLMLEVEGIGPIRASLGIAFREGDLGGLQSAADEALYQDKKRHGVRSAQ